MSTISSLGSYMGMMTNAMSLQRSNKEEMFGKVDTDGSGTVDQTELTSFTDGFYEKTGIEINTEEALSTYDTDGDGGLSQEEMEAMMEAYMPPPPLMAAPGEEAGGTGMHFGGPPPPPPDPAEMFANIDADGSGTIVESELATFVEELVENTGVEIDAEEALSSYDADEDGALSQEELDTMMAANMPPPPPPPPLQVLEAYNENYGDSDSQTISQLLSLFSESEDESQIYSYMPLNIKA